LKSGSLNLLKPSGPVKGMLYLYRERHVSNVRNESKISVGGASKISVIAFSYKRKDSGSNERLQS
jgi:hypothetical protein